MDADSWSLCLKQLHPRQRAIARCTSSMMNAAGAGIPLYAEGSLGEGYINDTAWSPDGELVAIHHGGNVRCVSTDASRTALALPQLDHNAGDDSVLAMAFSRDGKHLFVAHDGEDPHVRVQSLADPAEPVAVHAGIPLLDYTDTSCIEFAPGPAADRFRILRGASDDDGDAGCALHVLEKREGREWHIVHEFRYRKMNYITAQFSPDAQQLATAVFAYADVRDSGDARRRVETLRIYDLTTEAMVAKITHAFGIARFAWTPDGQHVVTVDNVHRAREYAIDTGALVRQFVGASCVVESGVIPLPVMFLDGHVELILRDGQTRALGVQRDIGGVSVAVSSPDGMSLLLAGPRGAGDPPTVRIVTLV